MRLFTLTAILGLCASIATAQTYPEPRNTAVNDYADMLPDEVEARITEVLDDLTKDTGAEATIVTLSSVKFYAQQLTVAGYATGLFNEWGIGDAEKGDGVLLLVFRDHREMRLELGDGYDDAAKNRAQNVVSETIIPLFIEEDFVGGIEAGATGIADDVVRNVNAASVPATDGESGSSNVLWYVLGAIGAGVAAIFGLNKRAAAKLAATPCSQCGVAGQLSKGRETLLEATETTEGEGERTTTCGACGFVERESYTIPKKKPAEDTFKGGKSKGDGASGKW
jgi:uncharacterized protein